MKTEDNVLTVHARQHTAGSSKEFQQKFSIPAGVKIDKLSSSLSKSGVLTISAPRDPLYLGFSDPEHRSDQQREAISQPRGSHVSQPSIVYDDDRLTIEIDVKDYRFEPL